MDEPLRLIVHSMAGMPQRRITSGMKFGFSGCILSRVIGYRRGCGRSCKKNAGDRISHGDSVDIPKKYLVAPYPVNPYKKKLNAKGCLYKQQNSIDREKNVTGCTI